MKLRISLILLAMLIVCFSFRNSFSQGNSSDSTSVNSTVINLPAVKSETTNHTLTTADNVTVIHDLVYANYDYEGAQHQLYLDLYMPDQATKRPLPVLVFIHGGGWWEGSKTTCPGVTFAQNGYATACIDYRLGNPEGCPSQFVFPAQIHDVKAAVRWLRQNSDTYELDASHIGAIGFSSGGHLAALLGTSYGVPALQGPENLGALDLVQAVVDWYGPVDVTQGPSLVFEDNPCTTTLTYLIETYGGESTPYFYWTLAWGTFLGGSLVDPLVVEQAHWASPLAYVDAQDPPFMVIHGEADGMVPIEQSELLVTALNNVGAEATLVRLSGAGHNFAGISQEVAPIFLTPTLAFLDTHLKNATELPELNWVRTGGPPGGLGYDIRYNFNNPDNWFVTDSFAGIHVSIDNGYSWLPSSTGIPGQAGATGDAIPTFSLTIDPHNTQIVWAGTDKTGHIYRSTDGGQHWQQRDNGVTIDYDTLSFRGFTVDPRSSDIVYAMAETTSNTPIPDATGGVVYRTTNGGEVWQVIWDGGMPSSLTRYLWIDPREPDVLYVSTGIFDRGAVGENEGDNPFGGLGILKSIDGGANWTTLNEKNGLDMLYIGSLHMHPQNPDILIAAAGHLLKGPQIAYMESLDTPINGIYRTINGGETWTHVYYPPPERLNESFSSVEYCPNHPNIAYAGSEFAVYRSEDAGQTWVKVAGGSKGWGPPGVIAMWPIDMQCDPRNPDRIFANNYMGGNFLSEDGGHTWQNASQGYTGAQLLDVLVHPDEPGRVYALGRSGIWRSNNGGINWYGMRYLPIDYPLMGAEWGAIGMDPDNPEHMVAGEASILETTNGGQNWTYRWLLAPENVDLIPMGIREPILSSVAFAASDPHIVYGAIAERDCLLGHEPCMSGVGVLTSRDGGSSWQQTSTTQMGHVGVMDLAVHPGNAQIVFAATENGLYTTTDSGTIWSIIGGLPANKRVRAVEIDPADSQHILAGVDGWGIYASPDGGMTWEARYAGLEPNNSLHDIVFDPTNPQIVYTSDYLSGVYRSLDGGQTWQQINIGLRNRAATALSISGDGQHLYTATNGEGVFRLDLGSVPPLVSYPHHTLLPLIRR